MENVALSLCLVSDCQYVYSAGDRILRKERILLNSFLLGVLFVLGCESSSDDDQSARFPEGTQFVFGSDISEWPVTMNARDANIRFVGGSEAWEVTLSYDRLQDIPRYFVRGDPDNIHNVNGTIWLIRQFEGRWYAGTIDYLRVGQMGKRFNIGRSYRITPQTGDTIGVLISTMNRSYDGTIVEGDPNSPYRERSNIAWTTWP